MNPLLLSTIISICAITAIILLIIYNTQPKTEISSYDSRYAQLVLLAPGSTLARTKDIAPKTCFDVTDDTLSQFSTEFRNALQNASQASENAVWVDSFLPPHHKKYLISNSNPEALGFLEKYNFTENKSPSGVSNQITYYFYSYNCLFNYHNKQYVIWFEFHVPVGPYGKHADVNFTASNLLGAMITNQNITVDSGSNSPVIFNNQLNHDVVLTFTSLVPIAYYGYEPNNIRIPAGQSLPYILTDFSHKTINYNTHSVTYEYLVEPDNLQGSFTLTNVYPPPSSHPPRHPTTVSPTGHKVEFTLSFVTSSDFKQYAFNALPDQSGTNPDITVKFGDIVTIHVKNASKMFHAFGIVTDPNNPSNVLWNSAAGTPDRPLKPGEWRDVTFVAGTPGTYHYICTVPGHAALGMDAKFIVN